MAITLGRASSHRAAATLLALPLALDACSPQCVRRNRSMDPTGLIFVDVELRHCTADEIQREIGFPLRVEQKAPDTAGNERYWLRYVRNPDQRFVFLRLESATVEQRATDLRESLAQFEQDHSGFEPKAEVSTGSSWHLPPSWPGSVDESGAPLSPVAGPPAYPAWWAPGPTGTFGWAQYPVVLENCGTMSGGLAIFDDGVDSWRFDWFDKNYMPTGGCAP